MVQLRSWQNLKEDFTETVLLGNGASIAVDRRFAYSSLLEEATNSGAITARVNKVFEHFKTSDFEFVMEMLWHASHINAALGVDDDETDKAYSEIRDALIKAVRQVHPEYAEVSFFLSRIGDFLRGFDTVISLNYDLITYWAMLNSNELIGGSWFKDCLVDGVLDSRWHRLREPYGVVSGATLVFYPHGHLALASGLQGHEEKIRAEELNNLLDCVVEAWQSGRYSPVFVSEGSTSQKINAITRSRYLSTVYGQVLPERKRTLVIYGWAVAKQDAHILRQLKHADLQRCAVSVYTGMADVEEFCKDVQRRLNLYLGRSVEVLFFDSASPGAWINA